MPSFSRRNLLATATVAPALVLAYLIGSHYLRKTYSTSFCGEDLLQVRVNGHPVKLDRGCAEYVQFPFTTRAVTYKDREGWHTVE